MTAGSRFYTMLCNQRALILEYSKNRGRRNEQTARSHCLELWPNEPQRILLIQSLGIYFMTYVSVVCTSFHMTTLVEY